MLVGYPLVPLFAVMSLGYCVGQLYGVGYDAEKRKRILIIAGGSALVSYYFIPIMSNLYGDPVKWTEQKDAFFTFLSFIKVNKYPPSLLYLLLTLGSALLFLVFSRATRKMGW